MVRLCKLTILPLSLTANNFIILSLSLLPCTSVSSFNRKSRFTTEAGSVLHSYVLCGRRRRLAGIGPTIGDVHCVELVEYYKCTKNQPDKMILDTLVVLDELYAVDVSDHRADAGKTVPAAAQHAAQHVAVQHAPSFPLPHMFTPRMWGPFRILQK
ncbi:hypothetical protein RHMOL_Rhmol07G0270000 [Rhododendron molle]|uniref:Uncharacterized protein n=1 Tax=Rhododendron molle TaxID=49168 RepID=A0ACC0N5L3_RHOML|nr:hypothetical protein RHMOL_Rhmol07G0270000 [Rhododendron molle]